MWMRLLLFEVARKMIAIHFRCDIERFFSSLAQLQQVANHYNAPVDD
jgi:hypothetical protein